MIIITESASIKIADIIAEKNNTDLKLHIMEENELA